MRRNIIPSLLLYGLIFIGLAGFRSQILILAIPLLLYLLLGLIFAPGKVKLEIDRTLSAERVAPGAKVTITLNIRNNGSQLEELIFEDRYPPALNLVKGQPRHFCSLSPGESTSWEYTVSGSRGAYTFSEIEVGVSDHLGLVYHQEAITAPGQLFVLPLIKRLRNITIRPRRTRVYSGTIPARVGGSGIDFFGVREYQTGDSPQWINWKTSARYQQELFTNEFEQDRVADVGIILDCRAVSNVSNNGHSLFEHSVSAAATLADSFLSAGNRVGLLFYGREIRWKFPGYGNIHRERLLQALSRAKTGDSHVFAKLIHIPTKLFPPHSQLVLVSPLLKDDLKMLFRLRSYGYQVMVISPDPVSYELRNLPDNPQVRLAARVIRMERNMFVLQLQRSGVQIVDWDVTLPLEKVLESRLGRPLVWHNAIGR